MLISHLEVAPEEAMVVIKFPEGLYCVCNKYTFFVHKKTSALFFPPL